MNPLQQQIEALLPNFQEKHPIEGCNYDLHCDECQKVDEYNLALTKVKQSLPKIIELIEKDTRERVVKKIEEEQTNEIVSNTPMLYNFCNSIINLINKE